MTPNLIGVWASLLRLFRRSQPATPQAVPTDVDDNIVTWSIDPPTILAVGGWDATPISSARSTALRDGRAWLILCRPDGAAVESFMHEGPVSDALAALGCKVTIPL